MQFLNLPFVLIILFIFVTNFSCTSEINEDIIATVDDYEISGLEFQLRYNFNPYLKDIISDKEAKKIVLSSLIVEKILFLESKKKKSEFEQLQSLVNQYLKEAMIEQLRQDSIESKIQISTDELKREYAKSLKEIEIKFVAFNSLEEANAVKSKIEKIGSFDQPIREHMDLKGWENEPIPTKKIIWGKENYELEESIYNLSNGEISNPVPAHNEYYLIQVTNINTTNRPSNKDFEDRLSALQDRITRNKISNKYVDFYNKKIKANLGKVNWNLFREIVDIMVSDIWFNPDPQLSEQNKPLSEIGYNSLLDKIRQNMEEELVNFPDGTSWSIKEVLENMNIKPYVFNFKNETLFRRSCARNLELMQEHEVIYKLAKDKKYENNINVKKQFNMWNSYYYANRYRQSVLDTVKINVSDSSLFSDPKLSLIQNKRLHVFDEYISQVLGEYSVKINKKLYDSIKLNKQDMVVVKSHFANRLVSPPLEPLFTLPKWSRKFDILVSQHKIN